MVMLDLIYMGSADLFRMGREWKIQNENIDVCKTQMPPSPTYER